MHTCARACTRVRACSCAGACDTTSSTISSYLGLPLQSIRRPSMAGRHMPPHVQWLGTWMWPKPGSAQVRIQQGLSLKPMMDLFPFFQILRLRCPQRHGSTVSASALLLAQFPIHCTGLGTANAAGSPSYQRKPRKAGLCSFKQIWTPSLTSLRFPSTQPQSQTPTQTEESDIRAYYLPLEFIAQEKR